MKYGDTIKLEYVEILPGIYHVTSDNAFDLAMSFLRAQEFYESDNPKIRGKEFDTIEFIRWYTLKRKGLAFTYPLDWAGFNVPSDIIVKSLYRLDKSKFNVYDNAMFNLSEEIGNKHNGRFYIIGTMHDNAGVHKLINSKDKGVLDHEIAHAFYYLSKTYRTKCNKLISSMSDRTKKRIYDVFENLGYAKNVWDDEIQAYMVAGIEGFGDMISVKGIQKKFRKLFEECLNQG